MASFTREDIESQVSTALEKTHSPDINAQWVLVLVLNRIEGHLATLAENTSETPELENIAEKLSRIGSIILDK